MASKRAALSLAAVSRAAVRPAVRLAPIALASACVRAAPRARAIGAGIARSYATHASEIPSPAGTPAMVGAQLRAAIESELNVLEATISGFPEPLPSAFVHRYLRPLTPEEVEFANMGQVPALPGGDIMGLLDLNLLAAPFDREKPTAGPDGKGVHVPLLAMAGTVDPSLPCYPIGGLFEKLAPRVVRAVHKVLEAQRKNVSSEDGAAPDAVADERSPLVAIIAPHDGDKRDLGIQLAIGFYRLAMHEGNGHQEDITGQ